MDMWRQGCNARDELPPLLSAFVIGENGTTFQPYASCHCVTVIAWVGIGQCEEEGRLEAFREAVGDRNVFPSARRSRPNTAFPSAI